MLRGAGARGAMPVGTAARVETHLSPSNGGEDEIATDVAALRGGAAALSQLGSRDDSVRLFLAAAAISPSDLRAHRRLAAALAKSGDRAAAADEYARYITVVRGGATQSAPTSKSSTPARRFQSRYELYRLQPPSRWSSPRG
jgi:DNA-binding SARP family transcriptional activator